MAFEQYKDVWVFLDCFQGEPKRVSLELLGEGRKIAESLGQRLAAVAIGSDTNRAVQAAGAFGADVVYVVEGNEYEAFSTDAYGSALIQLCEKYLPDTVLIGATANGRDLASKTAVALHTGLTADCTALSVEADTGNVVWERPAFGGNLYARILCAESRPQMGTVRSGAFQQPEAVSGRQAEVVRVELPAAKSRTRTIDFVEALLDGEIPVADASVVVSGGRGMRAPEHFSLLKELADLLGGTVGCSRAAVDAGWMPQRRQVGQTGTTVTPNIYFACGISGAVQHLAGMSESDIIVAVNCDEAAPIFEVADYCLVGDVFEVIPAIIEELKARRQV